MKTLELKLKKELLIVDLENDETGFINGNYEFLCDGSELTEEIASELVEMEYSGLYKKSFYIDYDRPSLLLKFAKESFISAVESKRFYWLEKECYNQFCENGKVDVGYNTFLNCQFCEEAEEKTFRNPLIFVKKS